MTACPWCQSTDIEGTHLGGNVRDPDNPGHNQPGLPARYCPACNLVFDLNGRHSPLTGYPPGHPKRPYTPPEDTRKDLA